MVVWGLAVCWLLAWSAWRGRLRCEGAGQPGRDARRDTTVWCAVADVARTCNRHCDGLQSGALALEGLALVVAAPDLSFQGPQACVQVLPGPLSPLPPFVVAVLLRLSRWTGVLHRSGGLTQENRVPTW
eukprot:96236-Rhodomonas_salina.3